MGGARIGTDKRLDIVEAYDRETNKWTSLTTQPMPTPRSFLAVAVHAGKLYAIGGADSSGQPLTTVEVYDPASGWSVGTPLPSPLAGLAAVVIGDVLYVRDASVLYSYFLG